MTEKPTPERTADPSDPSMEDILASIRRILNEEDAPAETAAPEDDILILDRSMMLPSPDDQAIEVEPATPGEPAEQAAPPPEAQVQTEPRAASPAEPLPLQPPATESQAEPPNQKMEAPTSPDPIAQPAHSSDLVAPEAAAAAASSVGSLVRTLVAGRATQVYSGGPTLEDLVRAELRPLLKEWLDSNLPPIVERLVRAEIERVVGRAVP
jgi:uncharacterized protein